MKHPTPQTWLFGWLGKPITRPTVRDGARPSPTKVDWRRQRRRRRRGVRKWISGNGHDAERRKTTVILVLHVWLTNLETLYSCNVDGPGGVRRLGCGSGLVSCRGGGYSYVLSVTRRIGEDLFSQQDQGTVVLGGVGDEKGVWVWFVTRSWDQHRSSLNKRDDALDFI